VNQAEIFQHTAIPPGDQAGVIIGSNAGKKPCAVAIELVARSWSRNGSSNGPPNSPAPPTGQGILRHGTGDDDDDRRLHIRSGMGQKLEAPDDLRHRQGREFLELELDHGTCFGQIGLGKLNDSQEDMFGGIQAMSDAA